MRRQPGALGRSPETHSTWRQGARNNAASHDYPDDIVRFRSIAVVRLRSRSHGRYCGIVYLPPYLDARARRDASALSPIPTIGGESDLRMVVALLWKACEN